MDREQRIRLISKELEVGSQTPEGWWPITRQGVEFGLLRLTDEGWRVEWRIEGDQFWLPTTALIPANTPREAAEAWAVRDVARGLAMVEELEEGEGPAGNGQQS